MTMLQSDAESRQLQEAIRPIAEDTSHAFHQEAQALKADLESFWRSLGQ
jgi:hypothetical protein